MLASGGQESLRLQQLRTYSNKSRQKLLGERSYELEVKDTENGHAAPLDTNSVSSFRVVVTGLVNLSPP